MKKGIIFDLDGTLWDSTLQITESWKIASEKMGINKQITHDKVMACMGMPMDKIFKTLFDRYSAQELLEIQKNCEEYENEYLLTHCGRLYEGVEQTLIALKEKGFSLYIVTNSQDGYVEAFFSSAKLGYLFDDYEMFGRTGKFKWENIKDINERNNLDKAFYVGDIEADFIATTKAGLPFVFAAYGMGDYFECDVKIDKFVDLLEVADKVI